MSLSAAQASFWGSAALVGLSLASIFFAYPYHVYAGPRFDQTADQCLSERRR